MDCSPHTPLSMGFSGLEYRVGLHLLQGIFPTLGAEHTPPALLHWQGDSLALSSWEAPGLEAEAKRPFLSHVTASHSEQGQRWRGGTSGEEELSRARPGGGVAEASSGVQGPRAEGLGCILSNAPAVRASHILLLSFSYFICKPGS